MLVRGQMYSSWQAAPVGADHQDCHVEEVERSGNAAFARVPEMVNLTTRLKGNPVFSY